MTVEEMYSHVAVRYAATVILWRGDKDNPMKAKELMEAARELTGIVYRMDTPTEEVVAERDSALLVMAEILYRKHSQRIMVGRSDNSDVEGLKQAKDYCDIVLPYLQFGQGKQFYQELDNTLLYIDILQFLENVTHEKFYVEAWHVHASSAYEASKSRLQSDDLGRRYTQRLLNPIISAKYMLDDLDAGEALIPVLAASGEKAEAIAMIQQAYQRRREELKPKEEKPKRKKLFGFF